MSKKNCLNRFLIFFDYFGVDITFRKNEKEQTFSSPIGGGVFLLFAFLSIYYCVLNFIPFSLRQNMNLVQSQKSVVPNSKLDFNERNMSIAFNLVYDENNTVLSDNVMNVFNVQAKLIENSFGKKNTTILKTKKCEPKDFYNKTTFEGLGLANFQCLDYHNLSIYGSFANPPFQYIEISVSLDKNIAAANPEYYMNLFKQNLILFDLMYLDLSINYDDVENPLATFIDSYIVFLDYWTVRKINAYFSSFLFSSDSNILYSDPQSISIFELDELVEYAVYMEDRLQNKNNLTLLKMYIRSSPRVTILVRVFQKATDYLANMSGLLSQGLLLIYIISNYVNSFIAEQTIMNKILSYQDFIINKNIDKYEDMMTEIKNRDKLDGSVMIESIDNRGDRNNRLNNSFSERKDTYRLLILNRKRTVLKQFEREVQMNNLVPTGGIESQHKDLEESHKIMEKSTKPIDFNICEIILRSLRCNRRVRIKTEIYNKSMKKLHYYFSIFTYIKTVQSIDIIKHLLLDKDQYKIFDFISQPSIAFTEIENDVKARVLTDMVNKNKMSFDDIKGLIKSYKLIKKDGDEGLNRKLCEYFNMEIEKFMG
jgi:hypothetical protein